MKALPLIDLFVDPFEYPVSVLRAEGYPMIDAKVSHDVVTVSGKQVTYTGIDLAIFHRRVSIAIRGKWFNERTWSPRRIS